MVRLSPNLKTAIIDARSRPRYSLPQIKELVANAIPRTLPAYPATAGPASALRNPCLLPAHTLPNTRPESQPLSGPNLFLQPHTEAF